jgi:hypothetical protein
MFKSRAAKRAGTILSILAMAGAATPACAAQDERDSQFETRRGAFAGASFRAEFGARTRRPAARLQLGFRSVARDQRLAAHSRTMPAFEIGLGGRESGNLFVAGRSTADIERSLRLDGSAGTAVVIAGGVALLVVGLIVIENLDDLGNDD